jgi:hypothetical protein
MYTLRLISRSIVTATTAIKTNPPAGFTYIHPFLDKKEQIILTKAALNHLDNVGSSAARRKLKRLLAAGSVTEDELGFLPEDQCYQFEEVSVSVIPSRDSSDITPSTGSFRWRYPQVS